MKYLSSLIFVLILLFSCSKNEPPTENLPDVNELADIYVSNIFRFYPEWGTFNGIEDANHSELSDNSLAGLKLEQSAEDSLFVELEKINVDNLTKSDLITYNILKNQLESSINSRICANESILSRLYTRV